MKKTFSTKWKASKQVRKQRKLRHNSPLSFKRRFLSCALSKELKAKYKRNSFPLRKGDSVIVMRGEFKKKKGKISEVDVKKSRVAIENLQRQKKDGTKVNVYFAPSNLMITELSLDDKKRINAIERNTKTKTVEKTKKSQEKNNKK